jgi:hypothetical protein
MTDSVTTNADHQTARSLLVRILIFQARHLIAGNSALHVPDLRKREQVFDLVNLMSFTVLFPALCSSSYAYLEVISIGCGAYSATMCEVSGI